MSSWIPGVEPAESSPSSFPSTATAAPDHRESPWTIRDTRCSPVHKSSFGPTRIPAQPTCRPLRIHSSRSSVNMSQSRSRPRATVWVPLAGVTGSFAISVAPGRATISRTVRVDIPHFSWPANASGSPLPEQRALTNSTQSSPDPTMAFRFFITEDEMGTQLLFAVLVGALYHPWSDIRQEGEKSPFRGGSRVGVGFTGPVRAPGVRSLDAENRSCVPTSIIPFRLLSVHRSSTSCRSCRIRVPNGSCATLHSKLLQVRSTA
jgi:hypothetical protein